MCFGYSIDETAWSCHPPYLHTLKAQQITMSQASIMLFTQAVTHKLKHWCTSIVFCNLQHFLTWRSCHADSDYTGQILMQVIRLRSDSLHTFHDVNENVLPAEPILMLRCCMSGRLRKVTCFEPSKTRCSYTCWAVICESSDTLNRPAVAGRQWCIEIVVFLSKTHSSWLQGAHLIKQNICVVFFAEVSNEL